MQTSDPRFVGVVVEKARDFVSPEPAFEAIGAIINVAGVSAIVNAGDEEGSAGVAGDGVGEGSNRDGGAVGIVGCGEVEAAEFPFETEIEAVGVFRVEDQERDVIAGGVEG